MRKLCSFALLICLHSFCAHAQVPEAFTLQALVTDAAGNPLTGYHTVTVVLYDADGDVVHSQTESGSTGDGILNMHVGPVNSVVFGEPLQIGITIDSDPELPRTDVEGAPYALGLRGLRVENHTSEDRPPNLIGGGSTNSTAPGLWGVTIGGGGGYVDILPTDPNRVEASWGTIGGGYGNLIGMPGSTRATIAGGAEHNIIGSGGAIGGGVGNRVEGSDGVVAGGSYNTSGSNSAVAGGMQNAAKGRFSSVPGGFTNEASGEKSLAAGSYAQALHDGTFVWQDATATSPDDALATFNKNQFRARASGGFYFQTAAAPNLSTGARLASNEGAWATLSSRNAKKDFMPVDASEILEKLGELEISTWRYATQDEPVRHLGPLSQDFYAAFGLGMDEEHISTVDADGVALAGIQALHQLVRAQQAEIEALRERIEHAGL